MPLRPKLAFASRSTVGRPVPVGVHAVWAPPSLALEVTLRDAVEVLRHRAEADVGLQQAQ